MTSHATSECLHCASAANRAGLFAGRREGLSIDHRVGLPVRGNVLPAIATWAVTLCQNPAFLLEIAGGY